MLASELQLLGIAAGGPYDQLVSTELAEVEELPCH